MTSGLCKLTESLSRVVVVVVAVGNLWLRPLQWRQADSIRHLGKVTLAQEQDYTGLVVGCVCVSLLLLLLGSLLMWRRNKHIDGKGQRSQTVFSPNRVDIRWKC